MNQDQFLSVVRSVLSILGTLGAAYGVGTDTTWATITSAAVPIAMMLWGQYAHSSAQKIASVSAMPEVKAITVTDQALVAPARAADPTTIVTVAPKG